MFNDLFERRHALKRHTSAPLLQERLVYLQYWADQKAKASTLRRIAQYLLIIMDALRLFTIRMISIDEIEKAALKWAENEKVHRRNNKYSKFSKRRFIYDAVNWFKMLGCLIKEPEPVIPFQELPEQYLEYMIYEQGLAEETVYSRSLLLKDFLVNLSALQGTFAAILPSTIDEVLTKNTIGMDCAEGPYNRMRQ